MSLAVQPSVGLAFASLLVALGCSDSGPAGGSGGANGCDAVTGCDGADGGQTAGTGGGAPAGTGSATASGGAGSGGATAAGGAPGSGGGPTADLTRCEDAALVWKTGKKTNYTSYPDPGSEECIVYNGCMWAGMFAHCSGTRSEDWVAAHDIAAVFPDDGLEGHDLCIRSGDRVMIVTAIDTCGDSDCDGCCTQNKGSADALIDLESYTNQRWGLPDGNLEWADLGANPNSCAQ